MHVSCPVVSCRVMSSRVITCCPPEQSLYFKFCTLERGIKLEMLVAHTYSSFLTWVPSPPLPLPSPRSNCLRLIPLQMSLVARDKYKNRPCCKFWMVINEIRLPFTQLKYVRELYALKFQIVAVSRPKITFSCLDIVLKH